MASEKIKKDFLDEIRHMVKYWNDVPDRNTEEKLSGLAFSILVIFDGEHASLPPFSVRPVNSNGKPGHDISGRLHDEFYNPPTE